MHAKMRHIGGLGASAALVVGLMIGAVAPAEAKSDSGTARFDNGKTITANMWIQSFSWTGCGNFQSSAVMNATPKWIKNYTKFYQIGFGSLSVKGVSVDSDRSSSSVTWTNSNGARGSYISGSVCGGWGAIYVGADVQASAFYYGNYRTAAAHV